MSDSPMRMNVSIEDNNVDSLGGTMPSHSLLLNFQADLVLSDQWGLSGTHYAKTLNIWLRKMDENIGIIRLFI